jgi:hypothetical protein
MKRPALIVLFIACVGVFLAGLFQIFRLRFESGDVYPEYSSLRADPLGTMALYESLEKMPGVSVRRDYSANNTLPAGRDSTYFHLAAHASEWSWMDEDTVKEIEGFVTGGGRLFISYYPDTSGQFIRPSDDKFEKASHRKKAEQKHGKKQAKAPGFPGLASLKQRWGLETTSMRARSNSETNRTEALNESALSLPETIEWHGSIVFTNLAPSWHVLYSRAGSPVLIERQFGAGSIAIATDSYFLSNEALFKDRHPDLLAWCVGSERHVIFDEAHLGVVESPGVAGLIRKYRLQGFIAALLGLAGLFVWKNSTSFLPPMPDTKRGDFVAGKDSAAGFVNLLRRNISRSKLLEVCFSEWKKSQPHADPISHARAGRIQALIAEENSRSTMKRDPLTLYRHLCAIVKGP